MQTIHIETVSGCLIDLFGLPTKCEMLKTIKKKLLESDNRIETFDLLETVQWNGTILSKNGSKTNISQITSIS